jgi:hypothetical protein
VGVFHFVKRVSGYISPGRSLVPATIVIIPGTENETQTWPVTSDEERQERIVA